MGPQGSGDAQLDPGGSIRPVGFTPFSSFPDLVARVSTSGAVTVSSGVGVLAAAGSGFVAAAHGLLGVFGVLSTSGALLTVALDGRNFYPLGNPSAPPPSGAWQGATLYVASGDRVDVAATTTAVISELRALFTKST